MKLRDQIIDSPRLSDNKELRSLVKSLTHYTWLIHEIESFWLKPVNQESYSWREHQDINTVMLATSLVPDGFLGT